jgi:ribonuclease G
MTAHDILINWSPQETRVAIIEHGAVQELHLERSLERGLVGNVYLGKVARVLPGMQSAFIDIGLERAAFLHVADLASAVHARYSEGLPRSASALVQASVPPIEKQVFEGQSIMVQVIKDPLGTKGARLTTQVSLAGRQLVFLPQDDHIGISQKITPEQREIMRARVQKLWSEFAATENFKGGGFILRTNAEEATDAELQDDMRYLLKSWQRIEQQAQQLPSKSVLHQDLSLLQRVLRDMASDDTQSVRIDSREQYHALLDYGNEFMPLAAQKLQLYKGERPIFDLYNVDEEVARALDRRVDLKSGGYLIIDQTEALTTIDVNTGGFVGARNFDDTIFKTNLEAAGAMARQLRLRNLGGVIIADFIDMQREDHRSQVLSELIKQLARDRTKTHAGSFSALGLVEMTRKRTRESLAHTLCEPCPACQGKGSVKTPRSVAYDVLREVLREARQFNPKEFRVIASPAVVELFLDEESAHLASLSDFIGKPISLQADSAMVQEQYDIVLM